MLKTEFSPTEGVLKVLVYPAEICLAPLFNSDYSIEKINLGLFGIYFLWSFNYVYLSVIKSTIKQLTVKFINRT